MEHNMHCKTCGHKVARVIGCSRELDCVGYGDRHYHCIQKDGCDDKCGMTGTCEPINDTRRVTVEPSFAVAN